MTPPDDALCGRALHAAQQDVEFELEHHLPSVTQETLHKLANDDPSRSEDKGQGRRGDFTEDVSSDGEEHVCHWNH
jgi:hypothetical protein